MRKRREITISVYYCMLLIQMKSWRIPSFPLLPIIVHPIYRISYFLFSALFSPIFQNPF